MITKTKLDAIKARADQDIQALDLGDPFVYGLLQDITCLLAEIESPRCPECGCTLVKLNPTTVSDNQGTHRCPIELLSLNMKPHVHWWLLNGTLRTERPSEEELAESPNEEPDAQGFTISDKAILDHPWRTDMMPGL